MPDAYLEFSTSSPSLPQVMFSPSLSLPLSEAAPTPRLRSAFAKLMELFPGEKSKSQVLSEPLSASLHGITKLT